MSSPPASPPSTSPAAIVEGVKQGNAFELQLIKQMRDGLNSIADGMEKECRNRSDACDEMREGLEAMKPDLTASRRSQLEHSLELGIRTCDEIEEDATTKGSNLLRASKNQWGDDIATITEMLQHLQGRHTSLERLESILCDFRNLDSPSTALKDLYSKLAEEYDKNTELYNQDAGMMEKMHERLQTGFVKEKEVATQAQGRAVHAARMLQKLFESTARVLGDKDEA